MLDETAKLFNKFKIPLIIFLLIIGALSVSKSDSKNDLDKESTSTEYESINYENIPFDISIIPTYTGDIAVEINGNVPYFDETQLTTTSMEYYSELDSLGRCGVVYACIGQDIMPTEERGEIGMIKPSGWHTVNYNGIVSGNYLYNRCHLIGYQLTGENDNVKNLITGTRSMNVEGMMPYENIVEDYVKDTGNHVMYRVTPVFEDDNLLATGVLMEAKSVEDSGKGIMFCVFIYNVQDGIVIDYATGDSYAKEIVTTTQTPTTTDNVTSEQETTTNNENKGKYAVNMRNGKIHIVGQCSATGTGDQAMKNAQYFDTYEEAEAYSAQIAPDQNKRKCGNCW